MLGSVTPAVTIPALAWAETAQCSAGAGLLFVTGFPPLDSTGDGGGARPLVAAS